MKTVNRRMATPYYKIRKQQDYAGLVAISFIVGAMMGASIALGVM